MKRTVLFILVTLSCTALVACGSLESAAQQFTGNLVNEIPLMSSMETYLPSPEVAADNVVYMTTDFLAGMPSLTYGVVQGWTKPQLKGTALYLSTDGTVNQVDVYARADVTGCKATADPGVHSFSCPLSGEAANRIGTIELTGGAVNWGPFGGEAVKRAVTAQHLYLGVRVTGGQAGTADPFSFSMKLVKGN